MRIVCPSCTAAYEVPDRLLVTGKKVRCARCGENWHPEAEPAAAIAPPPAAVVSVQPPVPPSPPPPPIAPRPPPPVPVAAPVPPASTEEVGDTGPIIPGKRPPGSKPPRAGLPVVVALGLSTLVLAGLLAAGFVWRGSLIAAWPPLQRLFGWLGLG